MFSRKHIVVGVATGAAVAIVLGLSVGYQQASVNRSSVASYAYGDDTTEETTTTTDNGEHHTMEECVKIGYYYVAESSGKSGKGGYRSKCISSYIYLLRFESGSSSSFADGVVCDLERQRSRFLAKRGRTDFFTSKSMCLILTTFITLL
jgi:hypothetical protein